MTFTPEEITAMAKEAGMALAIGDSRCGYIERFAALVSEKAAAKEREACAQVCENFNPEHSKVNYYDRAMAAAIRARGQKGGV